MLKRILIFWTAWVSIVVIGTILACKGSRAADWLELDSVDIIYRSFLPGGVDPLITENPNLPNRTLGKELNLQMNTHMFDFIYWDAVVHSMTDEVFVPDHTYSTTGQFRMVGLELGLGIDFRRIYSQLPVSFGYYHYSRHVLDTVYGSGPFPREDALEIKVHLFDRSYR